MLQAKPLATPPDLHDHLHPTNPPVLYIPTFSKQVRLQVMYIKLDAKRKCINFPNTHIRKHIVLDTTKDDLGINNIERE